MKALRVVLRLGLVLASGIVFSVFPTIAQTTPQKGAQSAAPGLQELSGDDAARASELEKAGEAALKADRWDEAIARRGGPAGLARRGSWGRITSRR